MGFSILYMPTILQEESPTTVTETTIPLSQKQEEAKRELRRRWRTLNGKEIGCLLTAYFRTFHQTDTSTKKESSIDLALKTFDGGLF